MTEPVCYCVLLTWTGPTTSTSLSITIRQVLILFRVKEKLRSGELMTTGDEWPIFIYQGYTYDPNDPWKGLFRSSLLVKVRLVYLP
jgi:hypothetical protein